MADFEIAYKLTLQKEGGYANHKDDDGGETYCGIARNFFPSWAGWKILDQKKAKGPIKRNSLFPELNNLVKDFFRAQFWSAQAKGDRIQSQGLANFIYDFCVNSGYAEREINKAINKAIGAKLDEKKSVLTDQSILYLNTYPEKIYPYILKQREQYVRSLKDFSVFGRNWLHRIASFPATIVETIAGDAITDKKKG